MYVVPVVSSTMTWHCTAAVYSYCSKSRVLSLKMCQNFVGTKLVSLFHSSIEESARTLLIVVLDVDQQKERLNVKNTDRYQALQTTDI